MRLSEVKYNETVTITKVLGHGSFRKRISEMGFIKGKEVKVIKIAPFDGPIECKILNYNLSLRKSEADLIEVTPTEEFDGLASPEFSGGVIDRNITLTNHSLKSSSINVALVGNPISGKTSLFNAVSGSHEKVGNFSGVTVEKKKAVVSYKGYEISFYDLPGTYSLTAYSKEEIFVREFIYEEAPDIVINVMDASTPERSLFLTTQLIDMDLRIIIALNMYDELEKSGIRFDFGKTSELLGIPMIPTISNKGARLDVLLDKIVDVFEGKDKISRHIHINYGKEIEESISVIRNVIREDKQITDKLSSRFLAIKLLEKDSQVWELLKKFPNWETIKGVTGKEIKKIESFFREESETVITNAKYGFISGALTETFRNPTHNVKTLTEKIDSVFLHKFWGFPIFSFLLLLIFFATFKLGSYPMQWIDSGVLWLSSVVSDSMQTGMLKDLLVQGIINGTGSVLVFLPNILILFFFISMLEGTGYMSRAAFIMDKIMHRFGLHGRSFIPLVMGFGCNVPAILSTRSMRNRGDRILTMLILPFMSCSARLPVYILIISAFFAKYQALYMIGLYAAGIFLAFLTSQILNKTVFKNKETPFVMELPIYRLPTLKSIVFHVWDKTQHYLKKIASVILIGVIIIWALEYFPRTTSNTVAYENKIAEIEGSPELGAEAKETAKNTLLRQKEADRLTNSYIGRVGKFIQPVMAPMGFDWKMTISLLTGLPAKEIIVSTMGVLYQSSVDENTVNLQQKLRNETHETGSLKGLPVFTTPTALAFLFFILIYFPCLGVVATISNESGSWKWGIFIVVYTTVLAWVVSFLVYLVAGLFII